jgi:iron only hydrogenase large subunit-like protein
VFDTQFSADLTILEEASEFLERVQEKGKLPMITSCSSAWMKYMEQFYPDLIGNISTCKSPMSMQSAITKTYFAEQIKVDPKRY